MPKFKDITNRRFGRLVAMEPTEERRGGSVVWLCECDCGNFPKVSSTNIVKNTARSCGCLQKEQQIKRQTKHGMHKMSIYQVWRDMIQRCDNPKNRAYKNYGGRGIKVCERWHTFELFYEDVGDPPKGKSLDRWPNNNGNYEPMNFRWASRYEQRLNSRPISCGPNKQRWFYGYGPNGEMIIENSQGYVARIFNLASRHISDCLNGKRNHHHGWTFKWLPDQDIPHNQPEATK
jgi:hypothetical protein